MTIKSPTRAHRKAMLAWQREIAREMRADEFSTKTIAERLGMTRQAVSAATKGIQKPHAKGW